MIESELSYGERRALDNLCHSQAGNLSDVELIPSISKRIGLVYPRLKYPNGDLPSGLLIICNYLKRESGQDIKFFDTSFTDDWKVIFEECDYYCFSVMITQVKDAVMMASFLKEKYPCCKIIFGGPQPTVMPDRCIGYGVVDAIVIGEGEDTLLDWIRNSFDFSGVNGFWYKDNSGNVVKNDKRQYRDELEDFGFPDWGAIDMGLYISRWYGIDDVNPGLRGTGIISTRGCPYQCTYCQPTQELIFGKKIRQRGPQHMIDELKELKKRFGIQAFIFEDDTFVFNRKWVEEFCRLMVENDMGLKWGCNVRANLVEDSLIKIMKDAGLVKVFMGVESGVKRILDDVYRKGITLEQVRKASGILYENGVFCHAYMMMGAPTETVSDILESIRFACSLPFSNATFSKTTPLPMTFLYNETKDFINKDVEEFDYYTKSVYKTGVRGWKLELLKKYAYFRFYLGPKRLRITLKGFSSWSAFRKTLDKLKRL